MSFITKKHKGYKNHTLENIKRVTIDDVTQIKGYLLLRDDKITVHQIEFLNQGKCEVICKPERTVVAVTNSTWRILEDGTIVIGFPKKELTCTST